jgi:hypothetical protein
VITAGEPELIVIGIIIIVAVIALYDQGRRHVVNDAGCTETLGECFEREENKQFAENQVIDENEFKDLINAVYDDLSSKAIRTAWDPARAGYDTPFYNGDFPDSVVCIGDKCSKQSHVNYFAQGMYSADTGQSESWGKFQLWMWNEIKYGHPADPDEFYWFEQGYKQYNEIKKKREQNSSSSGSPAEMPRAKLKLLDL